ncbi:hypothetical protein HPB47_026500 [Ixodes persulcatus]|uniref:Uncharacterized protein n=1 Tax=Ixodes persulcatus TaxID=34615 RepID=A0AC60Q0W9_IXOPE|nr:hypothetical protein HPB47_026500 [Ixodes persulcatus]
MVSLVAFCLSLAVISDFGLIHLRHVKDVPESFRGLSLVLGVDYLLVILPTCLMPRICLTYFFGAFRLYLRCIRSNIEACMQSTLVPPDRKKELLEEYRALLNTLKMCVNETGVTLGTGLMYTYGYAACLFCASIFYIFVPNTSNDIRLFFLGKRSHALRQSPGTHGGRAQIRRRCEYTFDFSEPNRGVAFFTRNTAAGVTEAAVRRPVERRRASRGLAGLTQFGWQLAAYGNLGNYHESESDAHPALPQRWHHKKGGSCRQSECNGSGSPFWIALLPPLQQHILWTNTMLHQQPYRPWKSW